MLNEFKNKKVLVMGLGLHGGGAAAARWLVKRGAEVTVTDLRDKKILKPSLDKLKGLPIVYILGKHRQEDFKKADIVAQNPGVPYDSPYLKITKKFGTEIVNEAGLFLKYAKSKNIIGITGTKGKSTTSTLVHKILRVKWPKALLAGNIRDTAMLDIADKVEKDAPVVLELSSWQLEGLEKIRTSPRIAVITNIYQDHLNRYQSYSAYIAAKENIIKFQTMGDSAVLNYDNAILRTLGEKYIKYGRRIIWFSKVVKINGAFIKNGWIYFDKQKIMPLSEIQVPGEHNIENILAAVCVAKILRVPGNIIRKQIALFKGVPNRLELIRILSSVKYYNDTTATAPDAAISALKTLGSADDKNIILIAGGANKKLDYKEMAKAINRFVKILVVFPGTATKKILNESLKLDQIIDAQSMDFAVNAAASLAKTGDIVLLSPGTASFGLFLHEFDRGEKFVKAVKELKPRKTE